MKIKAFFSKIESNLLVDPDNAINMWLKRIEIFHEIIVVFEELMEESNN